MKWGVGCRVSGVGCGVVSGVGCRVWGVGCGVWGVGRINRNNLLSPISCLPSPDSRWLMINQKDENRGNVWEPPVLFPDQN